MAHDYSLGTTYKPKEKWQTFANAEAETDSDLAWLAETPGDIARRQKAGLAQLGLAAGVGALATGGQLALSAIKTPQDKMNEKRLGELAKHKGLSGGERADIDEQAMRGVRTFATENQQRDEAMLAGSGRNDAASLVRGRREGDRRLAEASIQAADIGIRENRAQVQRDVREEQERVAYKSEKAQNRINLIADAISGMARQAGPVMAAHATRTEPSDAQLGAMATATDASGAPVYPGYQGLSAEARRDLWRAQMAAYRKGEKGPS